MRTLRLIFLSIAMAWSGPLLAQEATTVSPGDREAIVQVIRDQMAAFRRDDAAAAFAFAAPNIKGLFGNDADQFLAMVRHAYQPVYRPRTTQFGVVETVQGQVVQHVDVEGPDGVARTALYMMERGQDGLWRISGCVLTDSGSVGA